jgi:hypothetical protein
MLKNDNCPMCRRNITIRDLEFIKSDNIITLQNLCVFCIYNASSKLIVVYDKNKELKKLLKKFPHYTSKNYIGVEKGVIILNPNDNIHIPLATDVILYKENLNCLKYLECLGRTTSLNVQLIEEIN